MAKQPKRTAPAPAPVETAAAPFISGKWKGLDNYTCRRCPYATLDRGAMVDHVIAHEQRDAIEKRPKLFGLIVDTDGEPITDEKEG